VFRETENVVVLSWPSCPHAVRFRWHEHDPAEIISSVETCIDEAVKEFEKQPGRTISQIKAVGITNQRETTVVWDCTTQLCGQTLVAQVSSCLVLLDLDLTNDICTALVRELKKQPAADKLQDICGEPLTTYPSACKLLWLIRNVQQVKEAYSRGTLAFGTIDTWLAYKLNGGPKKNVFVSDPTNASRTMFMNIRTLQYDETLLGFFGLDRSKIHLPEIVRSSHTTAYGALSSGILPWPSSQASSLTVSCP